MQAELLGGGVVAVVDLQEVTGGVGVAGVVQAASGARVVERAVGAAGPGLRGGAVAVEQLDRGVVGRCRVRDVEAFAEDADAAVSGCRPALRVGGVAGVQLDRGRRGRVGAGDVGAQSAGTGDGTGGQPPDLPGGAYAVVELQLHRTRRGVRVGHVQASSGGRVEQGAVGAAGPQLAGGAGAGVRRDGGPVGGAGRGDTAAEDLQGVVGRVADGLGSG